MTRFLQQFTNGVVLGSTYAMIALGYTMVYGIIQLINFAHGEIFMVGAFGGLAAYTWLDTRWGPGGRRHPPRPPGGGAHLGGSRSGDGEAGLSTPA